MGAIGLSIEPNVEVVESQNTYSVDRNDVINRWGNIITSFQNIPGLVGFWPMSSVQRSTGNAFDLTGQGRTLTYNGNPTYNIYNDFMPYIDLDGTGDFLSRADETDLDVQGNETIYASSVRGMTVGGWFFADDWSAGPLEKALISKFNATSSNASFVLRTTASQCIAIISTDGALPVAAVTGGTLVNATWHNIIARFVPSTSLDLFIDGINVASDTTAIPATIFSGTAPFQIGEQTPTLLFTGRASLCFYCANALSNTLINGLFQQARILFGA